jgi:hypothetical protein
MIYRFREKHANHYAADEHTIGGVMISVLVSAAVDRGFIGGGLAFLSRKQ